MSVGCDHMQQSGARGSSPITPKRVIIIQALVIALTALIAFFLAGQSTAIGVACGGCSVLLPNALFATLFLCRSRARSGSSILAIFYLGEIVKLLLTAGLSILFLSVFSLSLIPLLAGVVFVSVSLVLAPLVPMVSVG